ncbi:MAG: OsmC family protein [Myxococcota bacterium]
MAAEVVTVVLGATGFRTTAAVRGHEVVLDEPTDEGGADEGPKPTEMLLGALGACTAMTRRMYAARKAWDLQEVHVQLKLETMSRADCVDCPPDPDFPRVDRIERTVTLRGDLTEEQLGRLLSIADKCPVHRVLTRHPVVVTTLALAER